MHEREIFGPLLPIVPVEDLDEAIAFINARYVCFDKALVVTDPTTSQRPSSSSLHVLEGRVVETER